jgi:hypothetical protein
MATEIDKIIFEIDVVDKDGVKSLDAIAASTRKLNQQRRALDLTNEEGQKKFEQLTEKINKNNEATKALGTNLEKQRLNVGNYTRGILDAIPGLKGFTGGINGISTAFKANPIGLAITAFLALKGIFEQNAVVADKLSFIFSGITKGLGFVIDTVVETVSSFSKLKEAIFSPIQFFSDLTKGTTDAAKAGYEAAESIDAFGLASAKAERAIQLTQVSIDSLEKSLKDKTKSEQERIKIATEIADLEIANAKRREDLAAQELANEQKRLKDKTLSGEEETALYKLETEVFNQQQQTRTIIAQKTSRINILTAKEESEALKAERDALSASDIKRIENQSGFEVEAFETTALKKLEIKGNFVTKNTEVEIKQTEEQRIQEELRLANTKKQLDDEQKAKEQAQRRELAFTANSLGQLSSLFKKNTLANQATAAAQALINTFLGVTEILGQKSTLPSPLDYITKAINVAAVLGTGLKAVTSIKSTQAFASGGLTGTRISPGMGSPISRSNGDNMLATVKTGEVILNQSQQARLGGASTFARIGVPGFAVGGVTGGFETQAAASQVNTNRLFGEIRQAFGQMKIVLPLDDFEIKQETKVQIQTTAQVI